MRPSSGCCDSFEPDVHCKGTDYTVDIGSRARGRSGLRRTHRDCRRSRNLTRPATSLRAFARPATRNEQPVVMRFLIVRLGALGDIVHAIPVAAAHPPRVSGGAHRLAGQREASRHSRSRAGRSTASCDQRSRRAAGGAFAVSRHSGSSTSPLRCRDRSARA